MGKENENRIDELLKRIEKLEGVLVEIYSPTIKIHVLPGGRMPERKTDGAIGYDVYSRVIVSPFEMDPSNPRFRLTLFDFVNYPKDPVIASHAVKREDGGYNYRMEPKESVLVDIGFVTEMPFPLFYWVTPRSGLASKERITLTNAPGTVDPDYRGSAGVLVLNTNETPYILEPQIRIAQVVFQWAVTPEILLVDNYSDLQESVRGAGGFGSTGLK
ncbi:dUTP diphosphatase [Candidatus Berkelbacteria bacterium]|nr:dUTP diphosphatase [Candidatus Berkelbacteria bacterium]MBI2588488.1 dUTP diphosphatase [Candidatus Berkelbacteria bacterium]